MTRRVPPFLLGLLLAFATTGRAETPLAPLPLSFVPNAGQSDAAVRFQADTLGGTLFFTAGEVVLALPRTSPGAGGPGGPRALEAGRPASGGERGVPVTVLRLRFLGASGAPEIAGADPLPGVVNVFRGSDPARWRTGLRAYGAVVYRALYPGIDLRYEAAGGRIKGSYLVEPGADPSRIRWSYAGARTTRLDAAGHVLVALPGLGEPSTGRRASPTTVVMEDAPVAWQVKDGRQVPVTTRYTLAKDGTLGFALPHGYDRTLPLVLDPTLTYSTYLGGGGEDVGYDVAAHATGTYVTGYTLSTDFPAAAALDPGCGTDGECNFGFYDAFVAKLDPSQSGAASLVFSTYLGGSGNDYGVRLAVDAAGVAHLTGLARADFPTTPGAYQTTYGGAPGADAFLVKLAADGTQLLYSTYLGGSGGDGAWGITLDGANHVYLAGETTSANFPATVGALDTSCGSDGLCDGSSDVFVAKLNPAAAGAAALLFASYLGGSGEDRGFGIARDATNALYLTGRTASTDFPTAGTPYQAANGGGFDAFLVKLNATGSALVDSTYFGGGGYEDGYTVALTAPDRVVVAGTTSSFDLPTTGSAYQPFFGGVYDAWLARFDPTAAGAASLLFSTYLGGTDDDEAFGLALDGSGIASVAGFTRSTDFPAVGALQPANAGSWDGFVSKLDPAASGSGALVYSTQFGGADLDAAYGVALAPSGALHLIGQTYSFNLPAVGAFQGTHAGSSDVFVAVIDAAATAADLALVQTDGPDPVGPGGQVSFTLTATNAGPATATGVRVGDALAGSGFFVSATPSQGTCGNRYDFVLARENVSCELGSLASGAAATVTIVMTATFDGVITANGTVSSNVSDPDGADNAAFASATVMDQIFADDFEGGDTSRWSATGNDGDLTVSAVAALNGTALGLRAVIDDNHSLHVEDRTPDGERRYRARFYFDPNGFDTGVAQDHRRTRIFLALEDAPSRRQVAIVLRLQGGQYALRARVRQDDGTVTDTTFFDISDGEHSVEMDWVRASAPGMNDGTFELWIDGSSRQVLTGLDTDLHGVDTGRLGALSVKEGASGTLFFDQFESRRQSYIGP